MAVASKLKGELDRHTVAVIGDGAMTAGMAFEALNHGGTANSDLLVVLNDNCMSIDPNVGALKEYLTDITTSHTYNKVKDEVWKLLGKVSKFGPNAQSVAQKVENAVKSRFAEAEQPLREPALPLFRPGGRPRCGTLGESIARPEGHSRPEDPAHGNDEGQGLQAR
jgi:deoxyxylulose-5-phosphate synthase